MEEIRLKMCKEKLLEAVSSLVNFTIIPWQKHSVNIQVQRFSTFIQILKLSDELYFIEKSPESLVFLLSALSLFSEFFVKFVLKTPDANLKLWDSIIAKEGIQKLDATVIDVDEACIIVQNAERMYQALSRYFHLVDVRQKALDLQTSASKQSDPLKAIIKIQAITRGYLTRKYVRALRDEENFRLGLNLEALIHSTQKYQTTKFLKDLIPEQRFFADDETPTPANSLEELEIFLRDNFFATDPLTLRDPPMASECRKIDAMTEYYFGEVFLAEAVKLQPATNFGIKFDDFISTNAYIKAKGGKICHIDLRNFFYATVIIPHCEYFWIKKNAKKKFYLSIISLESI
uniref:Uncharacterized protein n=1 Tax=Panagrolaimus davidi TaxID=227884 RepID=A0A914Q804_9BILA